MRRVKTRRYINKKTLNKTAIKYGIFTGFAVVIYLFAFYLFDKTLMRSAIVLRSSSLIYFIGMLLAALAVHRSATTTGRGIGNVLQEKEAATTEIPLPKMIATPFIVFLIANAYYALFFYWIMNVFDPELLQIHQELTHQEMLEYFKGTDQIANVRKNTPADYIPTLGGTISRYFLEAIGGFIVSALIGIGVRRT